MANIVNITLVNNGPRNVVAHVYLESDGASGELVDHVLIDPVADLGLTSSARLSIKSIKSGISGFVARVEFDTGLVDDKMIWVITEHNSNIDFKDIGGLEDRSGVDGTGKLQITTTGFTAAGDQGSIIFQIKR